MNLKLVTWEGDQTQFLVEADDKVKAIKKAVAANLVMGDCLGSDIDIHDLSSYDVEDVDFELLDSLMSNGNQAMRIEDALVFQDN